MIDHIIVEAEAIIKNSEQYELFKNYIGQVDFFFMECKTCYTVEQIEKLYRINERYIELNYWKSYKTKLANSLKDELLYRLEKAVEQNQLLENKRVRQLDESALKSKNIISVFESSLTRMLGIETDELSTDIIIVKTFYYKVTEDLILNGFESNGERYKFFTASAGQIRNKKTVFIKESLWNKFEKTLMCGLTVDKINAQGGINVNKFLAYLALSNSATDPWDNFDIDKCIVVPDFETTVYGEVDHIDDVTYTVTREEMGIPIEHTDGCGMVLPSVSDKNFMIRLPWVKGLLAVFDFKRFIKEKNGDPVIVDVWGDEHNIIEEDIQIIFTKSQMKMHKYYANWSDYKENFKKYNCKAGTCKKEEDYIRPASINYQMLQTLTDITDEEVMKILKPALRKLTDVTSNVGVMLDAFGAIKGRQDMNEFQEALLLYPELLEDNYCREILKDIKKSMIKKYRHGKLPVKGKYTFIVPDLYAFSERLFLHEEVPDGLLDNSEVTCRLYPKANKLDCLRAPHLYKEHAVRNNVMNEEVREWFVTDAVYTSSKDMISRILQFDNDGDTSLVVADETIIAAAERSVQNVVPLYYEMKKAEPAILTNEEFYKGMAAAWSGGNIGVISNDISKIWNSGEKIGDDEELAVKLLVAENNYVIDRFWSLHVVIHVEEDGEPVNAGCVVYV